MSTKKIFNLVDDASKSDGSDFSATKHEIRRTCHYAYILIDERLEKQKQFDLKGIIRLLVKNYVDMVFVKIPGQNIILLKWLYKHVHNAHHECAISFRLALEYACPIVILISGIATTSGLAIT